MPASKRAEAGGLGAEDVAVGTDPQRDGRGKPAECLCPDYAPASMAVGYFAA